MGSSAGFGFGLPAECVAERAATEKVAAPLVRSVIENGVEKIWLASPSRSNRVIEGIASSAWDTAKGVMLSSRGALVQFPVPLLSEHGFYDKDRRRGDMGRAGIGEVVAIAKSAGSIWARAIIHQTGYAADYAWKLIEAGEVACFSVSALQDKMTPVDGMRCQTAWRLREISICRRGADADAFFVRVNCDPAADIPSLEGLRAWRERQNSASRDLRSRAVRPDTGANGA